MTALRAEEWRTSIGNHLVGWKILDGKRQVGLIVGMPGGSYAASHSLGQHDTPHDALAVIEEHVAAMATLNRNLTQLENADE